MLMRQEVVKEIDIPSKPFLTLEEAAIYFNVGIHKIREITDDPGCGLAIFIGTKRLIKKKKFEEFLNEAYYL